ncbi:OsmC family protein [Thermoleptolyngbya sichuanensis A183]|uniref:OsmC family protein n=1 Tax=Thermoleptolyngbya sichuanensis A183 TaxID=2737172 RepID=A0A6M8B4Z1_9CYAN|nr:MULTISPECIES: OsmC family protein [Thermoleptolyngbya]QKD81518.1 OsmC family protein [Thermoleptolyngbya sichuanensis A183]
MLPIRVSSTGSHYQQKIGIRQFQFAADEPIEVGGADTDPTPTEYVLAGLGACKTMIIQMYAERKGWPVEKISVDVTLEKTPDGSQINALLTLKGNLTDEQRQRMKEIGDRCPVHKLLSHSLPIQTTLRQP